MGVFQRDSPCLAARHVLPGAAARSAIAPGPRRAGSGIARARRCEEGDPRPDSRPSRAGEAGTVIGATVPALRAEREVSALGFSRVLTYPISASAYWLVGARPM